MDESLLKLLLFDIDGTLLGSRNGIGRRVLEQAFEKVTGLRVDIPLSRCAGGTDPLIVEETLRLAGAPPDASVRDRILDEYLIRLSSEYTAENGAFAYPGVTSLIPMLSRIAGVRLGLLTGNMAEGARIKLEAFGLWQYFLTGAFASDSAIRNDLPPIAIWRAEKITGLRFETRDVCIIGDTANDVRAGKAHGLRTIALGTHADMITEIRAARPDHFLTGLADPSEFLAAVGVHVMIE